MRARVNPGDDARLPRVTQLIRALKPVPAGGLIGAHFLPRIGDDEAMLFRKPIHAGSERKIIGVLRAAVEHDDQRALFGQICWGYRPYSLSNPPRR